MSMHRLTFKQTAEFNVSIDLNDDVAEKLKLDTEAVNRYLERNRDQIVEAAQKAGGRKIVELLQAYAEEFVVPASSAWDILGQDAKREAQERWDREFGDSEPSNPLAKYQAKVRREGDGWVGTIAELEIQCHGRTLEEVLAGVQSAVQEALAHGNINLDNLS